MCNTNVSSLLFSFFFFACRRLRFRVIKNRVVLYKLASYQRIKIQTLLLFL